MKYFSFLMPAVSAGGVLAALLVVSYRPGTLALVVPVVSGIGIVVSGILSFTGLVKRTKIAPGALPGLLVGSMTFADLFIEDARLRIGIAFLTATLFFVLVKHLYECIRSHGFTEAVNALSEWSVVMIVFSASAGLLAAVTFLSFSVYTALAIFAGLVVFVCVTLARLASTRSLFLSGATALILIEGFILLAALPVSFWVLAALLAFIAYLLLALARGLTALRIKRTLIAAGVMGAVLLGTAKWR